jgi:hypothetical protein
MDNGKWKMDNGQWTMENEQWKMDNDPGSKASPPQHTHPTAYKTVS